MEKLADIGMFEGLQNVANHGMANRGMTQMSVFNAAGWMDAFATYLRQNGYEWESDREMWEECGEVFDEFCGSLTPNEMVKYLVDDPDSSIYEKVRGGFSPCPVSAYDAEMLCTLLMREASEAKMVRSGAFAEN